jgi:hypothetical protein
MRLFLAIIALWALPLTALADDVSDKLQSALDAYAKGDLKTATTDLAMANGAIARAKQARIVAMLPPAPDGWTLSVNDEYTANLAMAGGGSGTEANYTDGQGNTLTVSITADSPMMMGMAGMLMNAQMMAMMGPVIELPGIQLLQQENTLTGMIDQRIMVNISGLPLDAARTILDEIDFVKLASFDAAS